MAFNYEVMLYPVLYFVVLYIHHGKLRLCTRNAAAAPTIRKSPGFCADHLAFAVTPEVYDHADEVVDSGVCALVDKSSTECRERKDGKSEF